MGLTDTGDVFGWGSNSYYKLGFGDTVVKKSMLELGIDQRKPVDYTKKFQQQFSYLDEKKKDKDAEYKRLEGNYVSIKKYMDNVPLNKKNQLVSLRLSTNYSLGMTSDGSLYAWGYYPRRELSNNIAKLCIGKHSQISKEDHGDHLFFDISMFDDTSNEYYNFDVLGLFFVGNDLYCSKDKYKAKDVFENSNTGEVFEKFVQTVSNKKVDDNDKIVAVDCGDRFTLAMSKFGELYVWGNNDYGQHGCSTEYIENLYEELTESKKVTIPEEYYYCKKEIFPHQIQQFSVASKMRVTNIAAGKKHVVVIVNEKFIYTWGSNKYGQCGIDKK